MPLKVLAERRKSTLNYYLHFPTNIIMKKTYATILDLHKVDLGLLIFRIGITALVLSHGVPKLITFFNGKEIQFMDPLGLGEVTSFTLVLFAEFLCAVLILLGLATRLAAIPLIINFTVISLIVHWDDPFQQQELPLLYLTGWILLFLTGSGKYSLDQYFLSRKK